MLSIEHPYLIPELEKLRIGISHFRKRSDNGHLLVIKAPKEAILTAKLKKEFRFYFAPINYDGNIHRCLITTFHDDEDNPLYIFTPLVEEDLSHQIIDLLSSESFQVHFFDENNRELLGYEAKNPSPSTFIADSKNYTFGPSSRSYFMFQFDEMRKWFGRRTKKDDQEAIKIVLGAPLFAEDVYFIDMITPKNIIQKKGRISQSSLEVLEPGESQEMDIARLLCRSFPEDKVYLNPTRLDNDREFVDILIVSGGQFLLVQAKDSPNTKKVLDRNLDRKISSIYKALDKAIEQAKGATKYIRSLDFLQLRVGEDVYNFDVKSIIIRNLIVTKELFESEHGEYTARLLNASNEIEAPCLALGYTDLHMWTMNLPTPAEFLNAYNGVFGHGFESGIFPLLRFGYAEKNK